MSFLDVYIGYADNYSFDCSDVPKRQSPFFPNGSAAWTKLKRDIEEGKISGRKVDWGAWAAKMTKAEIQAFIAEVHPPKWCRQYRKNQKMWGAPDEYGELVAFVDALESDKVYILVASEL